MVIFQLYHTVTKKRRLPWYAFQVLSTKLAEHYRPSPVYDALSWLVDTEVLYYYKWQENQVEAMDAWCYSAFLVIQSDEDAVFFRLNHPNIQQHLSELPTP